jgi:DNA (cytosine-5)-methyltransferase 1
MSQRASSPTALSAFSGAGGIDLGLECAGFRILGCIENDKTARATLRANRPRRKFLEPFDIIELVKKFSASDLGLRVKELDLLAGGPPCQPFSKAAQWTKTGRLGIKDPRAESIRAFMTLAEKLLPKAILIENVPGFAKGRNSAIQLLRRRFAKINKTFKTNYRLEHRILDAVEYGVPQRRKRTIVLALRDGKQFKWPAAAFKTSPIRAYDALFGLKVRKAGRATGRWAGLLASIPEGENYLWHTCKGGGRKLFGYRTRYWSFLLKLSKKEPAWTLSAFPGPATGPFHWHNRPLAIKEMLRLQSFPASWRIAGDHRAQVRQVGNATPPLLVEFIARQIRTQVLGVRYRRPCRLIITRKRRLPAPRAPKPIPKEFKKFEGSHAPHPGAGLGPNPRIQPTRLGRIHSESQQQTISQRRHAA